MQRIIWSDYLKYRAQLRGFNLTLIEEILRYSDERYYDVETGRSVVLGRHDNNLVLIPYEYSEDSITPITIHATSRQQVKFRLKTGRYSIHELFGN